MHLRHFSPFLSVEKSPLQYGHSLSSSFSLSPLLSKIISISDSSVSDSLVVLRLFDFSFFALFIFAVFFFTMDPFFLLVLLIDAESSCLYGDAVRTVGFFLSGIFIAC